MPDPTQHTLRRQIERRREHIERALERLHDHNDQERTALEGKLHDLEGIIGEANWDDMPARVLRLLRAWLDEWPSSGTSAASEQDTAQTDTAQPPKEPSNNQSPPGEANRGSDSW